MRWPESAPVVDKTPPRSWRTGSGRWLFTRRSKTRTQDSWRRPETVLATGGRPLTRDGQVISSSGIGRHAFAHAAINLGVEPAIEADGRRHAAAERQSVSKRWLAATCLTGCAGGALIGVAIYAALDRHAVKIQAATYASPPRVEAAGSASSVPKGDRLVKKVDVVTEKQSFRAPTTFAVGNKQVIRLRGYTHVATTLTLTPTDFADQVPPFNPLKLLGGDEPDPGMDTTADPGPALDASDVGYTMSDLAAADPATFGPGLTKADVAAQVAQQVKAEADAAAGTKGALALPPQLLLMRTSRSILDNAGALAFANMGEAAGLASPSKSMTVTAENVTVRPRQDGLHDSLPEERLVVMRHGDALDDVLRGNGASREQVRGIVDAFGAKKGEPPVAEGRRVKLLMTETDDPKPRQQIARVSVYAEEALETTIALDDDGHYVKVEPVDAPRPAPTASADDAEDSGGMRLYDSIYQTALKQQIPKPVIASMIRIFANDVDFQQATTPGDSLDAFYANDDDSDGHSALLFASITVRDEVYRYYRFQTPDDPAAAEYFDDNGKSMRKFLIRTPVPSGIFTSGFGVRFHPILGYSRPHTGVDWAAPIGTPILSAGNGTVLKAERSSSYGNHIEIQHANGYITTYSHMVGFARGIAEGTKVRQGQVIGYLGQTGLATGPHLHYEVIANGHFVDPMRVKLAHSHDVEGRELADFHKEHDRIDALMASAPNAMPDTQKNATN